MLYRSLVRFCCLLAVLLVAVAAEAQVINPNGIGGNMNIDTANYSYDSQGRPIRKQKGNDSLQHRDPNADSITITFRYFDSTRIRRLDSSLNDFTTRYPVPWYYQDMGNFGNAARSLVFRPNMLPGFDPGFHAYDIYQFSLESTRFYQTTRPYTELAYMLGSKAEQLINIVHTQNRKSNFNFAFDYRLINSPGTFKNQNVNHNSIRFNTYFQSNNKRYTSYLVYITNNTRSAENGGIQSKGALDSLAAENLSSPTFLDVRLGNLSSSSGGANIYSSTFTTLSSYARRTFLYRHMYDFGQKDSVVTDSSVIRLFYPRFRVQHTLQYNTSSFLFQDNQPEVDNYLRFYNMRVTSDALRYKDSWKDFTNEFALISFPEKNNLNQYLKLGAGYQMLTGEFLYYNGDTTFGERFNNVYFNGEYRNRTRNQRWEVEIGGKLYAAGPYSGDYSAAASLKGSLKRNLGSVQLGFQNVNRTPSFIYENRSSFPSISSTAFSKENISRLSAVIDMPRLQLKLSGNYYLVTNYAYFDSFLTAKQHTPLFNVLHIGAEKKFRLTRHWNLYSEIQIQQKTGDAPVNLPLILTRNRLVFEGNFFKNLYLATGMELRYYPSYNADGYSPFTGQFFYQDNQAVSNRPDINLFLHFRIKTFKGFFRLENVNTINSNGSFSRYNFGAPNYPGRALWLRIGIWWTFIN